MLSARDSDDAIAAAMPSSVDKSYESIMFYRRFTDSVRIRVAGLCALHSVSVLTSDGMILSILGMVSYLAEKDSPGGLLDTYLLRFIPLYIVVSAIGFLSVLDMITGVRLAFRVVRHAS
jgi:hypothetical protein